MLTLGQHVDAAAAFGHGAHQGTQFLVVGKARRHGRATFAVVRFRRARREADRTGCHRLAHQGRHARDLLVGRGALGGLLTHHEGADGGMAGEAGDVRADTLLLQHIEILRKALETPAHASPQRLQRHALDMGQVAHGEIAVPRLAGRDGEAAIA